MHAGTMKLTHLTQAFDSKKQQLHLLDEQRAQLQQELFDLKREIQKEMEVALAPVTGLAFRSKGHQGTRLGRSRPRLSQDLVHQVLLSAGTPLSYEELEKAIRANHPHCKLEALRTILEMENGPAFKVRSQWKANENWVSKRGRPRSRSA